MSRAPWVALSPLMLHGALQLLCGSSAKDVLQSLIHLDHRIGGGCE
jgi:hypothetical protein